MSAVLAAASAGGAPLDQLAIIGALYGGGTAALCWLVYAHRRGRTRLLSRAAALASFVFRAQGWVALPVFVATVSLLAVMGGGFWDIAYHIDYGRDEGPLGNPGHYPLLFGFFGTFAAGILCVGLADERDASPAWLSLAPGWRIPVGALLLLLCAGFGMAALPLDDVWHRIFGQDVTLWSPTHFMLLGGATMSVVAMAVLGAEGASARRARAAGFAGERAASAEQVGSAWSGPWATINLFGRRAPWARIELLRGRLLAARAGQIWWHAQRAILLGGMLVGLESFLAEYDWGVPLYRQVWQPLLLAAFSAFAFTAARAWIGRGAALGAWASYAAIRSLATLAPLLAGRSAAALPLLLVPALCVELAALRIEPGRRPLVFGAVAGLACGTIGFAGEYAWSQLVMPLPWTTALIPEGLASAAVAGVAGAVVGALLATALRGELPRPRVARTAFIGAFAAFIAVSVGAGIRELPSATAKVALTDVAGGGSHREALATVRISPPDAANGANWLYVLAWQGGPGTQRVVDRLEPIGDGVYRSTEPIPLGGTWKSGLRLQNGRERGAVPIRLPADGALAGSDVALPTSFTAAGAAERMRELAGARLDAPAQFSRPFLDDGLIVLRESKDDVPGWLWGAAIALIFTLYAAFISGIAIGVARITRRGAPRTAKGPNRIADRPLAA